MDLSSNATNLQLGSPSNLRSQLYEVTKARLLKDTSSTKTSKNLPSSSLGQGTSLTTSVQRDNSFTSSLRLFAVPSQTTRTDSSVSKKSTPSTSSFYNKSPKVKPSLNLNTIKYPPGANENKSAMLSSRELISGKKLPMQRQSSCLSAGLKRKQDTEEFSTIDNYFCTDGQKRELKKEMSQKSLFNDSRGDIKDAKNSSSNESSPLNKSRRDEKKASQTPRSSLLGLRRDNSQASSNSPLTKSARKNEVVSIYSKNKSFSPTKIPKNQNKTLNNNDSVYQFDNDHHAKSLIDSELNIVNFDSKCKSATQYKDLSSPKEQNKDLDIDDPVLKVQFSKLQEEMEQDKTLIKTLQEELLNLQVEAKGPKTNITTNDTQITDVSFKTPEESRPAINERHDTPSCEIQQKELEMLRVQNDTLRMTIEILKSENQILKEAQKQSLHYKDMAMKYKKIAEAKVQECFTLNEEVINLRSMNSPKSNLLRPLYSDISTQNQDLDFWKTDSFLLGSGSKLSQSKISIKSTENLLSNINPDYTEFGAADAKNNELNKLPQPQTINIKPFKEEVPYYLAKNYQGIRLGE